MIRNGKVLDVSPFSFDNEVIPSIHSNLVKFLGRSIDVTIRDGEAVNAFKDQVFHGLDLIDKSFHRGIPKVWILQHLFIPRLSWPLLSNNYSRNAKGVRELFRDYHNSPAGQVPWQYEMVTSTRNTFDD